MSLNFSGKFRLEGSYSWDGLQGGTGRFGGELDVSSDGLFNDVVADNDSRISDQRVSGFVYNHRGVRKVVFIKSHRSRGLSDVVYELRKDNDGLTAGTYEGRWGILPNNVEFNRELGAFLGGIDLSAARIGGRAQITLAG